MPTIPRRPWLAAAQLYVRDACRLLGEYVLREDDLVNARPQEDVIALGSYNIDVGEIERTWRFLSLCPRRKEAGDLLVPLCLSASHVALASVRMEPTPMLLGHAAGLAAAQAARRGVAVQDVDVETPQGDLRDAGQVLAL